MTSHTDNLNLFRNLTGRTIVKPPVIITDVNRMAGYFVPKTTEIKRWKR